MKMITSLVDDVPGSRVQLINELFDEPASARGSRGLRACRAHLCQACRKPEFAPQLSRSGDDSHRENQQAAATRAGGEVGPWDLPTPLKYRRV